MTPGRHMAYRRVLLSVHLADFTEAERELLRDAAEGFLLAPSLDSEEIIDLSLEVVAVLECVVGCGRMSRWAAEQMKAGIEACGPIPAARPIAEYA
jgi:hypothetical protein